MFQISNSFLQLKTMSTSTVTKPFTINNNWGASGNTYVAIFQVSKAETFQNDNDFEQFLNRVKTELNNAKEELFNENSTDTLGGFDVQVATAGIKGDYVIGTLGGSAHSNLLTPDPVVSIGTMIARMLNIYFDKEYIFSEEVRTGEFKYTILALDIGGTIVKDDIASEVDTFRASRRQNESQLWSYSNPNNRYLDYNYSYYDVGEEVVEMSIDLALNLLDVALDSSSGSILDCPACDLPNLDCPDCEVPHIDVPDCGTPDCDCSGLDCGGLDCGGLDCSP
jgi:hypothetical protein